MAYIDTTTLQNMHMLQGNQLIRGHVPQEPEDADVADAPEEAAAPEIPVPAEAPIEAHPQQAQLDSLHSRTGVTARLQPDVRRICQNHQGSHFLIYHAFFYCARYQPAGSFLSISYRAWY